VGSGQGENVVRGDAEDIGGDVLEFLSRAHQDPQLVDLVHAGQALRLCQHLPGQTSAVVASGPRGLTGEHRGAGAP